MYLDLVAGHLVRGGEQREIEVFGQNERGPRVQSINCIQTGTRDGFRYESTNGEPLLNSG